MGRPKLKRPNYRLKLRGRIWHVTWTEARKPRSISTGADKDDEEGAQRFLDQFRAGALTPAKPEQPTVGVILDGYLKDRQTGRSEAMTWAAKQIKAKLANLRPSDLSKAVVRDYIRQRRAEKRSDGTIRRELAGTLRPALAWAKREGWIDAAPHIEAPSEPPPRDRYLTNDEFDRLLAECKARHVRLAVLLMLQTAGRRGAVLALKWEQVDLERGTINLGADVGKKRRATVPITDALRPALEEAYEIRTSDYVVEYRSGRVGSIATSFRKAARRAGMPWAHPHLLRHSAATWMSQKGVALRQIARFLGDSEEVVEKRYAKHSPEFLKDAAAALENVRRLPSESPDQPRKGGKNR